MSKPDSRVAAHGSSRLGTEPLTNLLPFENKLIAPVEQTTFHTINFAEAGSSDTILFSTDLTACAVVIIKNRGEKSGLYDNVVTMAHFYPANAVSNEQTADNILKIFDDFREHGGEINGNTSIILLGGGIYPGEDFAQTTPTGSLYDCLHGNQSYWGYKFTHHKSSLNDLTNTDGKYKGSMAFVNRDGTSILRTISTRERGFATISFDPLTKEIESMPFDLLARIGTSCLTDSLYPEEVQPLVSEANKHVAKIMKELGKPMIPLEKSTEFLGRILQSHKGHSR